MVKIVKEFDGRWTVYNTYSGETATIIRFKEQGILANSKPIYRIDVNNQTAKSMITHFATAKAEAKKLVS